MKPTIGIIGAGISGLIAALTLEEAGYAPVIYEASSSSGGRIKTDLFKGYQLDRGFQVLLDAYPKTSEYLDYESLGLQKLQPGAILFGGRKVVTVGDPSRDLTLLLPTVLSGIGTLSDYFRLFRLHRRLQKTTITAIFDTEEKTTFQYLKESGFSDQIIEGFLRPFFSGIFLENELTTSSRMFQFVFKMFGEGNAVIPKAGMGALVKQLEGRLKNTTIHYNSPIAQVKENILLTQDGDAIKVDRILIAADPSILLSDKGITPVKWHGCDNLYFEAPKRIIDKKLIGLITAENALINNIFYPTCIETSHRGPNELLSVTVVKNHSMDQESLVQQVKEELALYCGIQKVHFLKHYRIKKSLPTLNGLQNEWVKEKGRVGSSIFLAGDHLLYGSTNAAMISGESAAQALIGSLTDQ